MTIKEIEERSGLSRANIRFYEQQGLLCPERGGNGYRNYSEQDLETLRRIRLLRALGVGLEDIAALVSGAAELDSVLDGAERRLEDEKRTNEAQRRVCAELRRDGAEFKSLDAQRYLDSFDTPPAAAQDREEAVGHPVRRFFARSFDFFLCGALLDLTGIASVFDAPGQSLLLAFFRQALTAALMLVLEPLLLHFTGTTPGKFILGISLEREDGSRPSYGEGFARTAQVIWRGMGWQVPVLRLVRLGKSYAACADGYELPWEEDGLRMTVRGSALWRGAAIAALTAAVLLGSAAWDAFKTLPPNRGNVTVAEYAENFNSMARQSGCDGFYMTPEGKLTSPEGTAVVDVTPWQRVMPEFSFETENGIVTAVRAVLALPPDSAAPFWYDDGTLTVAALSLCADDINVFAIARSRARLVQFMQERFGHNLESSIAGLHLIASVETNGSAAPGVVVSDDGVPLRLVIELELIPEARGARAS